MPLASWHFRNEKRALTGKSQLCQSGKMSVACPSMSTRARKRLEFKPRNNKQAGEGPLLSNYTIPGFQSLTCNRHLIHFLNKTSFQECTGLMSLDSFSCLDENYHCGYRGFSSHTVLFSLGCEEVRFRGLVHTDSTITDSQFPVWLRGHQTGIVLYIHVRPFSYWAKFLEGKNLGIFCFEWIIAQVTYKLAAVLTRGLKSSLAFNELTI